MKVGAVFFFFFDTLLVFCSLEGVSVFLMLIGLLF